MEKFKVGEKVRVHYKYIGEIKEIFKKPMGLGDTYRVIYEGRDEEIPLYSLEKLTEAEVDEIEKPPEKVPVTLLEGLYVADEYKVKVEGKDVVGKFAEINDDARLEPMEKYAKMAHIALKLCANTKFEFKDGRWATTDSAGNIIWGSTPLEYEIKGNRVVLWDNTWKSFERKINITFKDDKIQQTSMDGAGNEMVITFVKQAESS